MLADGKRVALIEMERAGGTCLNHGCKPTKALRATAAVAHQARRAAEYGVGTGEVTVDFPVAIGRVRSIIATMQQSLEDWVNGLDGLDYIHGTAKLRSDPAGEQHQVTVGIRCIPLRRFTSMSAPGHPSRPSRVWTRWRR